MPKQHWSIELRPILMCNGEEVERPEDFEQWDNVLKLAYVFEGVITTVYAKSFQYGNAWQKQGWMGNLARVQSKVSRLKNMLWRDEEVHSNSEPVQDTLQDLIALAAFMLLNRGDQNKWGTAE